MTNKSLFQPAASAQRHLKVLLHGGPGTGKTRAALSFPGPLAVLDLEGGTSLYDGDFQVLRTKDIRVIEQAINELTRGGYATVVIDPLTVLWHLLQDAGQALVDRRKDADSLQTGQALSPREWGLIKRKYNSLLTRLINLPMHVVLIARDTDLYEGTGDQLKRVGTKADAEKGTPYLADFVFSMQTEPSKDGTDNFIAVVEKSRSNSLPKGSRLTDFHVATEHGFYRVVLKRVAARYAPGDGAGVALQDDADVAAGNAGTLDTPPAPAPAGRPQTVRVDTGAASGTRPAPAPAQDSAATQEPSTRVYTADDYRGAIKRQIAPLGPGSQQTALLNNLLFGATTAVRMDDPDATVDDALKRLDMDELKSLRLRIKGLGLQTPDDLEEWLNRQAADVLEAVAS